jgi:hypothetical protein
MLSDVLSGLGQRLADRWAAASLPASVFWAGALAAYLAGHGGAAAYQRLERWVQERPATTQIALLAGALLVVATSAAVSERLATPILRLLEGYHWPPRLGRRLVARSVRRGDRTMVDWRALAPQVEQGRGSTEQQSQFLALERRRRRAPADAHRHMPTRLGNLLRAAETRPIDKYGLDPAVCWPQLWLLLPDTTRRELAAARAGMDLGATLMLWSVLSVGLVVWTPWALAAAGVAAGAHAWLLAAAQRYGELLEAAFDLYRASLYRALRWPLPATPAEEPAAGQELTRYLWRGSRQPCPAFTPWQGEEITP